MTTAWSFGAYKCTFLILRKVVPQEHAVLNCVTQQTDDLFNHKQNVLTHNIQSELLKPSVTFPQLDP